MQGCEKKIVNLYNVGPVSMQVMGWNVEMVEVEDGFIYYIVVVSLVCELFKVIDNFFAGLSVVGSIEFEVEYCGLLNGMNVNLVLDFNFFELI